MARVLDLKTRKKTHLDASSLVPMERISTPIERDVFLAAISVVPAAIVWIGLDHLYAGIALGVGIFLAAEYGYPRYKEGRIDFTSLVVFTTNVRDSMRSRIKSNASI